MFKSEMERKKFEFWAMRHGFDTSYYETPETSYYNRATYVAALGWLGAKKIVKKDPQKDFDIDTLTT